MRSSRLRDRFLAGASPYPLGVLTGVNFIDQFDGAILALLAPEIIADFHSDATTFGYVTLPQLLIVIPLPFLLGYLGDRVSRVKLVILGTALWVVGSVLTAASTTLIMLALARILSSAAKSPTPAYLSLLPDYYPSRARGFAFGLFSSASNVGYGVALLVGGILGQFLGWRITFFLLGTAGFVLFLASVRLREPARGLLDALDRGETDGPPVTTMGPIRTARLLLKTPAYKRLAFTYAVVVGALIGSSVGVSFYFSAVFDVGPALRGVLQAVPLPLAVVATVLGGRYAQRLLDQGRARSVARFMAAILGLTALAFAGLAFAPNIPIALVFSSLASAGIALAVVPVLLLVARLTPPPIRSQGFGLLTLYALALVPITLPLALYLGDSYGFRFSVLIFTPMLAIGGLFAASVGISADKDIARLDAVGAVQFQARQRRAAVGTEQNVLDVSGINAGYGNVQILFDVAFQVGQGEIVALLGTNGAGKSTLLRVISGLITPTAGSVLLEGEDVTGLDADITASRGLVLAPGGHGIFPRLTVERNLQLGSYLHWKDPDYVESARREVLELFPRLGERLHQEAGTLSGGEQQMLTLAQALMSKPRVLMIDELSLGLAPVVVQELLVAVREINARGVAVVLVEQSVNIALSLARRAYFLEKGEVRFEGGSAELLERPDLLRSIFLESAALGSEVAR